MSANIPSEVDIHSVEGLTKLFRFGVGMREDEAERAALSRTEERLKLAPYTPRTRGALEDAVAHLDQLGVEARFEWACDRIAAVSNPANRPDGAMTEHLLHISSQNDVVRFSFSPAVLLCLKHARAVRKRETRPFNDHAVRYAGVGADVQLVGMTALFLNLPIYAEAGTPWDPDRVLDGEPDTEPPDIEITFPPSDFRREQAPGLEISVRTSRLPRAVDRGKYDLESVMLDYLCKAEPRALAFTSEKFITSTNQSRLKARQNLLQSRRICRVAEYRTGSLAEVLIETCPSDDPSVEVRMVSTDSFELFSMSGHGSPQVRGKSEQVTLEEILAAGSSLAPTRYLAQGPTGGRGITAAFKNMRTPTKYRLADLFEVVRPKATKDNSVGELEIKELRPSDLSEHGQLLGPFRQISVKASLEKNLEEQQLKAGDIVFAHRGPYGRVAYVTEDDIKRAKTKRDETKKGDPEKSGIYAAQSLFIFRARRRTSSRKHQGYCDPRALFMYLMTERVRAGWEKLAIGDRSPSLPIGEIERFAIPSNLVTDRKPGKGTNASGRDDDYTAKVIYAFKDRQDLLRKMRDLEDEMNDGLQRVWETSWSKS